MRFLAGFCPNPLWKLDYGKWEGDKNKISTHKVVDKIPYMRL